MATYVPSLPDVMYILHSSSRLHELHDIIFDYGLFIKYAKRVIYYMSCFSVKENPEANKKKAW